MRTTIKNKSNIRPGFVFLFCLLSLFAFVLFQWRMTLKVVTEMNAERIASDAEYVEGLVSDVKKKSDQVSQNIRQQPVTDMQEIKEETVQNRVDRVYCMVPTMYKPSKHNVWNAIILTWGKRCNVIKFFVDQSDDVPPYWEEPTTRIRVPLIQVPMVRKTSGALCLDGKKCRHIWEKVWRSWVYISHHDLDKAEWFCKIDDDTFFFPANVKRTVREKNWHHDEHHYFGHKLWHQKDHPLIGGACAVMSRLTVRQFSEVLEEMVHEYGDRKNFKHNRCVDRDGATEERTSSICLSKIGVVAEGAYDNDGRERVLLFQPSAHLAMRRKKKSKGWYWLNKPARVRDGDNCCALDPIAFHGYKNFNELHELEDILYHTNPKKLKQRAEIMYSKLTKAQSQNPENFHRKKVLEMHYFSRIVKFRQEIEEGKVK